MLRAARIALAAFAVIVVFFRLGDGSLRDWDESLTAERSREMLATGGWFTPRMAGQPDFNKPPLYYALTSLALKLHGENEGSVRFWSAVFSLSCLLFCERIATRLGGNPWAGLLAAFLLATNAHWLNRTREGLLDSGVMFGFLGGLYFLLPRSDATAPGETALAKWARPVLAGLCLAAGTLIKHPLPFLALSVALLLGARRRETAIATLIAVAAGLSWYVAMWLTWGAAFTDSFIRYNLIGRATAALDMHAAPPWFYFAEWLRQSPLTLAALAMAIILSLAQLPRCFQSLEKCAAMNSSHWKFRSGVFVAIALALLAAVSAMTSKRDVYLLLVYPPAAIGSACLLSGVLNLRSLRFAGAAVLIAAGLWTFFPRYVPRIDGNPALKEISLKLRDAAPPAAVALAAQLPVATIMFYSHCSTTFTWLRPVAEVLGEIEHAPSAPVFVVVNRRATERMKAELTALSAGRPPEVAASNSSYSVLVIRPGRAP